jgi:hypothetical protein
MNRLWTYAAVAAAAAFGLAAVAAAAAAPEQKVRTTPKGWSYNLDQDGKRLPKGSNRTVNPDGSWREETKVGGGCVQVKQNGAGEYREFRDCSKKN